MYYCSCCRCRVPICDDIAGEEAGLFNAPWMEFAIPKKYLAGEFLTDGFPYDPCHTYAMVDSEGKCEASNFIRDSNTSLIKCQHGFVYDDSIFPETVVTKWDIVCDNQYKARLLGTMMMFGLLFGSLYGGFLGDKVGRKKALMNGLFMIGPNMLVATLSPNYYVYAFLKFINSTGVMIVFVCASTILLEAFSLRHRILISSIKELTYPACQAVLALIAYLVPYWKYYHITVGCLCLISLPLCWILPESFRWLAENDRQEEAFNILKDMAKTNGKTLTEEDSDLILKTLEQVGKKSGDKGKKLSFLQMFNRHYFLISIVLCLTWAVIVVSNFTMNLNATKLSGDVFLNYGMVHVIEIPIQIILFASFVKFR